MLSGALARLFRDLDKIQTSNRSPYEAELHSQLIGVAKILDGAASLTAKSPSQVSFSLVQLRTQIKSLQMSVSGSGDPDDVDRLRCDKDDCPNKRQ